MKQHFKCDDTGFKSLEILGLGSLEICRDAAKSNLLLHKHEWISRAHLVLLLWTVRVKHVHHDMKGLLL